MKTIFITIFEGVEAKNILRTDVLKTLLEQQDVRLVLFVKNQERIAYFKKEFNDPRLIYEVVDLPRLGFWNDFFEKMKSVLLRTDSTDLKRQMNLEITENYLSYFLGKLANLILARPSFRKLMRWLDYRLVKTNIFGRFFEIYKPGLVFLAHIFEEKEVHLLREARRRGVPTIGFINSWDKITSRGIMRLLPDKMVVFNSEVLQEAVKHNEMAAADIFVSGIPHYDHYFIQGVSSREKFFKKINCDVNKKLVVYAPMGRTFSDVDWSIIDLWYQLQAAGELAQGADLLVRFQPNDFIDEGELKKRPWLRYDYPGFRFTSKRGVDWDMNFQDLDHLRDTLAHMSLLICFASSMSVDAAIFDKPVININFEIQPSQLLIKSPSQYFRTEHYKKALATGAIKLVNSRADFIFWVNKYLKEPSLDKTGRRKLVSQQCQFIDGRAGRRIGEFILKQLERSDKIRSQSTVSL